MQREVSVRRREEIVPAVAALTEGDKVSFNRCGFIGLQDTLWDGIGRRPHYVNCYIEGVIDIISGAGQSIYQKCEINVAINLYAPILSHGYVTAQQKDYSTRSNGFVFDQCSVIGSGRAYRPFSTVIFHHSFLSAIIDPSGWDPWAQLSHLKDLTFVELDCGGPGANTSRRVPWLKRLPGQLRHFTHISFIDQ